MGSLSLTFIISAFAELQIWHLAVVLGTIGGLGGSVITVKSQALQVKVKPFVDSARITGGSKRRIMLKKIMGCKCSQHLYLMRVLWPQVMKESKII